MNVFFLLIIIVFPFSFQTIIEETAFEDKLLKEHQNKTISLQPRMCLVGDKFQQIIVHTVEQKYFFEDPIEALNCCFKCFLALNTEYPRESNHLWEFLQKKLFEVNTQFDKNYTTISSFICSINNI